ncbi:translation initiation factor IF-2-like [Meles meles]|uniref:translation initiation factor IF-2-like n=1 Tax=Meles meles TaxID=9662 RepID=UPI001E69A957|nr:translation initiation factor IF-2-like [Meles meles]
MGRREAPSDSSPSDPRSRSVLGPGTSRRSEPSLRRPGQRRAQGLWGSLSGFGERPPSATAPAGVPFGKSQPAPGLSDLYPQPLPPFPLLLPPHLPQPEGSLAETTTAPTPSALQTLHPRSPQASQRVGALLWARDPLSPTRPLLPGSSRALSSGRRGGQEAVPRGRLSAFRPPADTSGPPRPPAPGCYCWFAEASRVRRGRDLTRLPREPRGFMPSASGLQTGASAGGGRRAYPQSQQWEAALQSGRAERDGRKGIVLGAGREDPHLS